MESSKIPFDNARTNAKLKMDRKPTKKRKLPDSFNAGSNAAGANSSDDGKKGEDAPPLSVDSLDESVDLAGFAREHQHTITFPDKVCDTRECKHLLKALETDQLALMLLHISRECKKSGRNIEEECISWDAGGKAVVVRDQNKLCDTWLPLFFGQAKYSSFTRKLYRWEFRKLNVTAQSSPGWVYFQNDNFQRDRVDLRRNMKSVTAIKLRNEAAALRAMQNEADQTSSEGSQGLLTGSSGSGVAAMDRFPIVPGSTSVAGSTQITQNSANGNPWNMLLQAGDYGRATPQQSIYGHSPIAPTNLSVSDITLLQSLLGLLGSHQDSAQVGLLPSPPSADSSSTQQAHRPIHQPTVDSSLPVQTTLNSLLRQRPATESAVPAHFVRGPVSASSQQNHAVNTIQLLLLQQLQLHQSSLTPAPVVPQGLSWNQTSTANLQPQVHHTAGSIDQSNVLSLLSQLRSPPAGGSVHPNQTTTSTGQNSEPQQLSQETVAFIMNLLAQLRQFSS